MRPRKLTFAVVADREAELAKGSAFLVAHSHLRGLGAKELRDRQGVINGEMERETVPGPESRSYRWGWPIEISPVLST